MLQTSTTATSASQNAVELGRFLHPIHHCLSTLVPGQPQQYRRDSPCRVGKVLHFLRQQGAAQHLAFSVGQPLLQDLIAAQLVVPHRGRDVAPPGVAVQVNIDRGIAQCDNSLAPSPLARLRCSRAPRPGPGRASLRRPSRSGPSRRSARNRSPLMFRLVGGGREGDGRQRRAQHPSGHARTTGVSGSSSAASSRPSAAEVSSAPRLRLARRLRASRAGGCVATPCAAPRRWPRGRPGRAVPPARGRTGPPLPTPAGPGSVAPPPTGWAAVAHHVAVKHQTLGRGAKRGTWRLLSQSNGTIQHVSLCKPAARTRLCEDAAPMTATHYPSKICCQ